MNTASIVVVPGLFHWTLLHQPFKGQSSIQASAVLFVSFGQKQWKWAAYSQAALKFWPLRVIQVILKGGYTGEDQPSTGQGTGLTYSSYRLAGFETIQAYGVSLIVPG